MPLDDTYDKRMRLRYAGRCRLCDAILSSGTDAIYERERRTVRCLECASVTALPTDSATVTSAPELRPEGLDALRLRPPASSVIAELLRVQASVTARTGIQRFFGRSPLGAESRSWFLGVLGELAVAELLDQLGPGWCTIHAVPVGSAGSDVDHLVIGPGGVFTINSKFHEGGNVWVGSRRLLVNGQRTDHLRNAEFEARRAGDLLSRKAHVSVDVVPVIAIVAARRITVRERPERVVVLAARRLPRWLRSRPTILAADEVTGLGRIACSPATWGHADIPTADLAQFAELRRSVATAQNRRRLWGLTLLLGSLAALTTLTASALGMLS